MAAGFSLAVQTPGMAANAAEKSVGGDRGGGRRRGDYLDESQSFAYFLVHMRVHHCRNFPDIYTPGGGGEHNCPLSEQETSQVLPLPVDQTSASPLENVSVGVLGHTSTVSSQIVEIFIVAICWKPPPSSHR